MVSSPYQPAAGTFLISEPFMGDPNFQRTVVLLIQHNEEGSLGFVINRRLQQNLPDIVEGFPPFDAPVFLGGPVEQDTLHFLHRLGDTMPGSQKIVEGVYWGGDFDALRLGIKTGSLSPEDALFFVGYSGWGPGQLKLELKQKSWIVAPAGSEFVFTQSYENLWQRILRNMGDKYRLISNYPLDPSLN